MLVGKPEEGNIVTSRNVTFYEKDYSDDVLVEELVSSADSPNDNSELEPGTEESVNNTRPPQSPPPQAQTPLPSPTPTPSASTVPPLPPHPSPEPLPSQRKSRRVAE